MKKNLTSVFGGKLQKGFTLIEILVVIGIIAVLALIVLVAINPARQFAQARNTQRTSNVEAILNAIGQNMVDNKGVFSCTSNSVNITIPSITTPVYPFNSIPAGAVEIKNGSTADLSCLSPTYIPALPFDPSSSGAHWTSGSDYSTGYYVFQDSSTGRVTVFAPNIESALGTGQNYLYITR
ncbi:MAG: type II secretion system protein [Candidatus Doudnabacteria bacterium]|nr:type II secretion system protein [Candidatus Doudnabacteria bacterium]